VEDPFGGALMPFWIFLNIGIVDWRACWNESLICAFYQLVGASAPVFLGKNIEAHGTHVALGQEDHRIRR